MNPAAAAYVAALSALLPVVVAAVLFYSACQLLRVLRRRLLGWPTAEPEPQAPYGVGPTGVARRTVPVLAGLTVRERS